MLTGVVSVARVYDTALSQEQVAASFAAGPTFVTDAEIDAKLSDEQRTARSELRKQLAKLSSEIDGLKERAAGTKAYTNVPQPPGVTRVLARGDLANPGAVVSPAGLAAISGPKAEFGLAPNASDAERAKLAEGDGREQPAVCSRDGQSRVALPLGAGLVETPSDFGFNGGRPSHRFSTGSRRSSSSASTA